MSPRKLRALARPSKAQSFSSQRCWTHLLLLLTLVLCGSCSDSSPDPAPVPTAAAPNAAAPVAGPSDDAHSPAAAQDSPAGAWFVEVSQESGLEFLHDAGLTPEKRLAETMGAGAVLADLNGDGHLDAYLVQSGPLPIFPRDRSLTNRLFFNDGQGRFHDETSHSGAAAHDGYGMGATAGDIDLDGDLDLFVTNFGPDVLLLNDGTGAFADRTTQAGVGDPRWTAGAIFFDGDGDGDPDLYVTAYVDEDLSNPPWCGRREDGWRSACHPDTYPGLPDRYWRNLGGGLFEDATESAGLDTLAGHHGKGLGVIAVDVDGDLDLDLYVANDSVENRLWLNRGDGRFDDGTLLSGTGVNQRGLTEAGMGLAAGDVDDDGDPDLFVTNFDDESNTLYRNDGDGLFADVTAQAGLDAASRLPVGFGTFMGDLDGDGQLDVAVTNGHIIENIHLYHDGKRHAQQALVFGGQGAGRFEDVSATASELTDEPRVGRGLYGGDLDGDGDLDLLLTNCGGPAQLYRNQGGPGGRSKGPGLVLAGAPEGSQLKLQLVSGRTVHRFATTAPSYFGMSSPRIHVGLGADALAQAELLLPDGQRQAIMFTPPLQGGLWQLQSIAGRLRYVSLPDPPNPGDTQR